MKVEIYSDVICPWCYIGKRRFDQALAEFAGANDVEITFHPFQLDPSAPKPARPVREYLTRRYGDSATRMMAHAANAGRAEGLEFDFDAALAANTFDAHRLLRLAGEECDAAVVGALAEALFAGHFTRGLDVGDHDVLARLAGEAGLEEERVRRYLASDAGSEEVEAALESARSLGIHAVPTFVIDGRYVVQGAQPASIMVQALETAAREASGDAAGASPDNDEEAVCELDRSAADR